METFTWIVMMDSTLSPLTRLEVFSRPHTTRIRVSMTMTGSTLRMNTPIMDIASLNPSFTTSGRSVGASLTWLKKGILDMICLQTSSGIRGTVDTFLDMYPQGSRELRRYVCFCFEHWTNIIQHNTLQKVLSFIQNTVNPIGFEVDDIGGKETDHYFGDDFVKSPEYILDSEDYFWNVKIKFNRPRLFYGE